MILCPTILDNKTYLSREWIFDSHRNHSLWVLTQKYYSVSKDVREQIKWLCLFFTKDRDSFEDCLRENDVIPDKNERDRLKKCLQDRPYSKLILKCYQPTGYHLL